MRLELVQLGQDGTGEHILDHDLASALGIKIEEELAHGCDHIEWIECFLQLLKLREGRHEFEDVVLEVLFAKVPVASCIVQGYLNARLEQVHLAHDVVEEWDDLNAAVLIALKLQERRRREELLALGRQLRRHVYELVVVDTLRAVLRMRYVFLQQEPEALEILSFEHFARLVLQEARSRLLSHPMVQAVFLFFRLLEEELWDDFEARVALLLNLLLNFKQSQEFNVGVPVVLSRRLVRPLLVVVFQFIDPIHIF